MATKHDCDHQTWRRRRDGQSTFIRQFAQQLMLILSHVETLERKLISFISFQKTCEEDVNIPKLFTSSKSSNSF